MQSGTDVPTTASPAMAWLRTSSAASSFAVASFAAVCSGSDVAPPAVVAQLRLPTRSSSACCSPPAERVVTRPKTTTPPPTPPDSSRKLRAAVLAWSTAVDVSLASTTSLDLSSPRSASDSSGSPAAAQPPRWSSAEPWPSPSAFGTPKCAFSPVASEVPSPATIGTMRVLPRLKQKVEKMRTELASHKADADSLRRELQAEKERSALLATTVASQSAQLTELEHLRTAHYALQRANAALEIEIEDARSSLLDTNARARDALLSIQHMAEAGTDRTD